VDLSEAVKKLNQWTSPGILRYFQQDLISGNEWRWVTHMQYGRMILKSPLVPGIIFITGEIGTGFKIEFYFRDEELYPLEEDGFKDLNRKDKILSIARELLLSENNQSQVLTLSIGHPNFAHFIRDQLPALLKVESLLSEKFKHGELLVMINAYDAQVLDSFGGVERLLPSFNVSLAEGLSDVIPNNSFSIGSRILSHETHLRIKSQFVNDKSDKGSEAKLVLSHRLNGRMPSNDLDLYIELAYKWIVEKDGVVVLDGWNLSHVEARKDILQRVGEHSEYLSALGEACLESIPASKRSQFSTTSGMSLRDSILSMKGVTCQVAPWGTVHHKCAWVWNSERFVLLPPSNTLTSHQRNILNHFEGSRQIYFLPECEVLDESTGSESYISKPYRVRDVKRAAKFILDKF
jgi:hypothetical protein